MMDSKTRLQLVPVGVGVAATLAWALWPTGAAPRASDAGADRATASLDGASTTVVGAAAGSPAAARRAGAPALAPGSAVVEYEAGLLTVLSNGVARSELLKRVAQAAKLQLIEAKYDPTPLDLRIESTPLEQALPQLLSGIDYALEYRFTTETQRHVASVLRVAAAVAGAAEEAPVAQSALGTAPIPNGGQLARGTDAVQQAREEAQHDEFRALLTQRAASLAQVPQDPDAPSLTAQDGMPSKRGLTRLLATDDVPQVRAAAAFQLGAESGEDVSRALVDALHDRSEVVTLQAIASLVQIGDARVLPQMSALQEQHGNADVRAALGRAVDDLREGRPSAARASTPGSAQ